MSVEVRTDRFEISIHLWFEADRRTRALHEQIKAVAPLFFRTIRKRSGLTQRQFADRLGVKHTYISKIERGYMTPGQPILAELYRFLMSLPPVENTSSDRSGCEVEG